MGEFRLIKLCKPAIGNHTTPLPNSTSEILWTRPNRRFIPLCAFVTTQQVMPPSDQVRWKKKGGGHGAGNQLDGECQTPLTP